MAGVPSELFFTLDKGIDAVHGCLDRSGDHADFIVGVFLGKSGRYIFRIQTPDSFHKADHWCKKHTGGKIPDNDSWNEQQGQGDHQDLSGMQPGIFFEKL